MKLFFAVLYVSLNDGPHTLQYVSGVARILLQGARARGARVPKFVVTVRKINKAIVCPMPGDVTARCYTTAGFYILY